MHVDNHDFIFCFAFPFYLLYSFSFQIYYQAVGFAGSAGIGFTPHVITVKAGEVAFLFSFFYLSLMFLSNVFCKKVDLHAT